MPAMSILNVKKFSLLIITAAGLDILSASCRSTKPKPLTVPTAPTTWTITVDVSGGSISYPSVGYSPASGGCPYANSPINSDPRVLHVCPSDYLIWQTKSSTKKSEMVVFTSDGILATSGPKSNHGSDDQATNPVQVTPNADGPSAPPHEWYVAVFDKNPNVNKMYYDDPKIIIGQ